jgi:hypothetical protein
MNKIYVIKDRTDANIRKPFVAICKTEASAKQKVANIQSKLRSQAQNLISYEAVSVNDFDMNKTSVYVVYDKTDSNFSKPFMSMHFDFDQAKAQLKTLRAKVSPHAQKLIYARTETLM